MKIQCGVCKSAEAVVLCCADEAALCWACDEKVHAANKFAGKHKRVPLTKASSSTIPNCDICQEASGYFFCLEDRALLCRNCDVAVHSANPFVSDHQRFLITGVKIGKQAGEATTSSSEQHNRAAIEDSEQGGKVADLFESRDLYSGEAISGMSPGWPLDEFFEYTPYGQAFGFPDHGSPGG